MSCSSRPVSQVAFRPLRAISLVSVMNQEPNFCTGVVVRSPSFTKTCVYLMVRRHSEAAGGGG